jgi:hypothetical protein
MGKWPLTPNKEQCECGSSDVSSNFLEMMNTVETFAVSSWWVSSEPLYPLIALIVELIYENIEKKVDPVFNQSNKLLTGINRSSNGYTTDPEVRSVDSISVCYFETEWWTQHG